MVMGRTLMLCSSFWFFKWEGGIPVTIDHLKKYLFLIYISKFLNMSEVSALTAIEAVI